MFYMGIVEDRLDPLELGRVRVRVYNIHNQDKTLMPTSTLPWATVVLPTTSASTSGVGTAPNLIEGSFVLVHFLDPDDMQHPIILGSIPGINSSDIITKDGVPIPRNSGNIGFQDPTGTYPDSDYNQESDLPRQGRSGSTPGLRDRVVVNGNAGFSEPEDIRPNRRYPFTNVTQTESGHIEEKDDTPGNERIYTQHRSGTFNEMRPDGTQVNKIVGDGYEIVARDKNVYVKGACNIYVENDCNLRVQGDYNIDVEGDLSYNVKGATYFNVEEDIFMNANGSINQQTVGGLLVNSSADIELNTNEDLGINVGGSRIDNVYGNMKQSVTGTYTSISYGNTSQTIVGNHSSLVYGNSTVAYNANKIDTVFGNYSVNTNGTSTISSVGENIISSRQTMSVASKSTVNVYSPSDVFIATGTINFGATGSINYDAPTIDLNSNITPIDTGDIQDSMDFNIIEESLDAVNTAKPSDEDMMQVIPFEFGENESEVTIEIPEANGMSTTQGTVTLDEYIKSQSYYQGSGSGGASGGSGQNASASAPGARTELNSFAYDGDNRSDSNYPNVKYRLGGTRNKVCNGVLEELLSNAASASGVEEVVITSGKQPGTTGRTTGSLRHHTGMAADLFCNVGGRRLDSRNSSDREVLSKFVRTAVAMGIRGGGMGSGYMGTTVMHIDTLGAVTDSKNGAWDGSRISTWKSEQWFIEAMTNPDSSYSPSASYQESSSTISKLQEVSLSNNVSITPGGGGLDLSQKEAAQKLGQALLGVGFNEEEALAGIACAMGESSLKLVEESSYAGTSNSRIRSIFSSTKNLSDSQLNQIKSNKFTFFEYIYGYQTRTGRNLGNIEQGDGGKYIGRGFIQITGRYNYEKYGGSTILNNPELLSSDWDTAAQVCANYLKERYARYKGKKGGVVADMAWAIKGSSKGVNLTLNKDRRLFRELDRSWLYPSETRMANTDINSSQRVT